MYVRRLKALLVFSVVVLVAVSAAYLMKNPGKKIVPAPLNKVDVEQAEVVIDGFNFSKTDDDESSWELNARKAEVSKDTGIAKLDDLDAVYKTGSGSVLSLKAEKGVFDTGTKGMELYGGGGSVVVTSDTGYEMTFKDVRWDNSSRELSTDDLVTIVGKNVRVDGKGMVARADLQEVSIFNGVKTVFSPSR